MGEGFPVALLFLHDVVEFLIRFPNPCYDFAEKSVIIYLKKRKGKYIIFLGLNTFLQKSTIILQGPMMSLALV